ncbi:MAG: GNAT family N-acetyltransferase [Chloracidobacterium sp.]|nr:GNAT family N-acetyltransferase [Chloracidobacterium sp.]
MQNYKSRFFYCGDEDKPIAFVAIIEVGTSPFRFGLIDRGPYFFAPEDVDTSSCLLSLTDLFRKLGYAFVRFTQGQESVFSEIRDLKGVEQIEPYPFCRDSRNSMLIEQKEDDAETISSFSETARKRIRRAIRFNYDISSTNTDADFEKAWQLFENLASKKGFELSPKPKIFWRELLKQGAANNFARLYLCSYQGELIAAQLHVRDGEICEAMLAALDLDILGENPSPAALMFFTGMRFGYEFGCGHFNIGGPGDPTRNNHLFDFKRKFKPTLHVAPEPFCLVLSPHRYRLWMNVVLRGWRAWRYRFGKSNKKTLTSPDASSTNEEVK